MDFSFPDASSATFRLPFYYAAGAFVPLKTSGAIV
jgi:hypothetical protein